MWFLRFIAGISLVLGGVWQAWSADGGALSIKQATVGFEGKYKAGSWQPVSVSVVAGAAGAKGRLELVAPDCDQTPVIYRDAERGKIELAAGQEQTVLLYAKCGPIEAPFRLQLVGDDGVVWSQALPASGPALASTQEFFVALGPDIGLAETVAVMRRRDGAGVATASVRSVAGLPDRWWGYSGVDVLVLTTSEASLVEQLSEPQRTAVIDWVRLGGRIILSCGNRGEEIASSGSPWAALVPGEFEDVEPLRDRVGLENFTKHELPFNDPGFQRNRPLVTRLKNVRGEVLLDEQGSSGTRPLVIHAPVGLGQVTFVAFDLDHPALKDWKGRTRLLATLLTGGDAQHQRGEQETHRSVAHLGYDDLIGQLRSALDHFPNVSIVNFTTVALFIVGYLLVAAPGDYFFLSRLSLPRHWTWITFPLVILATVVAAAAIGRQGHGQRMRLNQVEVVDIDLDQQVVRGSLWAHLYSPTTRRASALLEIEPPAALKAEHLRGWLAWQGLPGDSLGGLESRQPALVEREAYVSRLPGLSPGVEGFVIPVASAKSLSGRWWAKTKVDFQSRLTLDRYGLLAGELVQPLDVPLEECLLAHGEKLYRLGSVAAGQRLAIADFPPLDLEARLTQRRIEQSKDIATPWEKDSTDVPRIVQMLMFHEAARGQSYTGLSHRYQGDVDLSESIRLGRAVLVGRAKGPASQLVDENGTRIVADEASNIWTWYRVVYPVNK